MIGAGVGIGLTMVREAITMEAVTTGAEAIIMTALAAPMADTQADAVLATTVACLMAAEVVLQ